VSACDASYIVHNIYDTCVGLFSVLKGETTLPVWSYVVALISGAIVAPFSTLLYARMGDGIATNQLFKMIAGAVNPGRPVANLYVGLFDVLSRSFFKPLFLSSQCGATTSWRLRLGFPVTSRWVNTSKYVSVLRNHGLGDQQRRYGDTSPFHVLGSNLGNDYR
jgi:hypothetical protein